MALTIISGPSITTGNTNSVQNTEPDAGPNVDFQGSALADPRFVGAVGAAPGGKIFGVYANPYFSVVDAVPQPATATRIAAGANAVSGVPMVLTTTQGVGVSPAIPVVPFGQAYLAANVVNVLALDFGFTTANTVAGSPVLTIPANAWRNFKKGQNLIISGGGVAPNTPLLATVLNTVAPNATTITLNVNVNQTMTATQVGTSDLNSVAAQPYAFAGAIALSDPTQNLSRGISITGVVGGSGGAFLVKGYDIFGQAMSETITVGAGAVTTYGNKAFKYISSVTPQFTNAFAYSVGTADSFGFAIRSDFWEYMNIFWNGTFLSVSTGWTGSDNTLPATAVTGDVRGTIQVGTLNKSGAGAAGGPSDGIKRLAAFMSLPMYNAINTTNLNYVTLFGATQA